MIKTSLAISPLPAAFSPLLFSGDWKAGFDTATELGYDAVELSLRDPADALIKEVMAELHHSGLALSAIATGQSYYQDGLSLINPDPVKRVLLFDRLKRCIDLAAPWSSFVILGGVRGSFSGDPIFQHAQRLMAIEIIMECAIYATQNGTHLLLEPINRYETNFLNTVQDCLELISEGKLENVSILADTFHMNIEEPSIPDALIKAGSKLAYLHLADSNRRAPGQGHLNFDELVQTIKKTGFAGYVCAEILPIPTSHAAAELAIEFYRSIDLLSTPA